MIQNIKLKDEIVFISHSNPIENAGLIEQHSRDLHNALVATINNNVAAVNGTLAVVAQQQQQQQQQQQTTQQQQQTQQNTVTGGGGVTGVVGGGGGGAVVVTNNNGLQLNGTTNSMSGSSGRSTPNNNNIDSAPGKLFVGGLSWQTSSDKLKEYFNMFGTVTDVLIMKDPITQRSRGFGFITFQETNSVENVLKVPIHTLDGKKIDPKHATPKNRPKQTNKTKKIFVGGVSQETSSDEVKGYFNQFGKVEETVMLMDQQTKRHRGFGFVTFENEDVVDRVCEIHFHTIKNKKVECKKAQPKESVTPTAQLLQKRLMLGSLAAGVRMTGPPGTQLVGGPGTTVTVNPLTMQLQTQQLQVPHAAQHSTAMLHTPFQLQNASAAAAAAAAGYGKLLTTYPPQALHNVRYTPYPMPASAAAAAAAAAAASQQQHQQQQQQQHHQQQQQQQQQQHHHQQHHHHHQHPHLQHQQPQTAATAAALAANGMTPQTAAAQQAALAANAAAVAAAGQVGNNPYQGYTLANVDMSSFQGVDWGSMYGMGMYV